MVQSPASCSFPQLEAAIAAGLGQTVLTTAAMHAFVDGALAA